MKVIKKESRDNLFVTYFKDLSIGECFILKSDYLDHFENHIDDDCDVYIKINNNEKWNTFMLNHNSSTYTTEPDVIVILLNAVLTWDFKYKTNYIE